MKLKALRPVLYLAHQYDMGDELPVNNPDMVDAWLEAGSAEWRAEGIPIESSAPKAIPAAALAGQPGISDRGTEGDLTWRIPETPERKKPAARKKKTK